MVYTTEELDYLAQCLRDEIDEMIFKELFKEVERNKKIVESIIPKKLFEV